MSWFGHLQRMDEERPARMIWNVRVMGRAGRGRARTTWNSHMTKVLETRGLSFSEAKKLARNRKEWVAIVHGGEKE